MERVNLHRPDPDLEAELEAHGLLLVLPKLDCFGEFFMHENRAFVKKKSTKTV